MLCFMVLHFRVTSAPNTLWRLELREWYSWNHIQRATPGNFMLIQLKLKEILVLERLNSTPLWAFPRIDIVTSSKMDDERGMMAKLIYGEMASPYLSSKYICRSTQLLRRLSQRS